MRLTDAGEVVFARSQAVLAEVARLRREVAEVDGMARGEAGKSIPLMAGRYLAPVIGAYRRQYPGVKLRLGRARRARTGRRRGRGRTGPGRDGAARRRGGAWPASTVTTPGAGRGVPGERAPRKAGRSGWRIWLVCPL
ncbi:hypothetical protein ACU4GD_19500 [Cupriavidus basilensis]